MGVRYVTRDTADECFQVGKHIEALARAKLR